MKGVAREAIMFTPEHVLAIREGRKTQTRRVLEMPKELRVRFPANSEGDIRERNGLWQKQAGDFNVWSPEFGCPYGRPRIALWVREPWRTEELASGEDGIRFKADNEFRRIANTKEAADDWMKANDNGKYGTAWRNAMFMPRWACRLMVEITAVRVEQVQEIRAKDVEAEGIKRYRREPGQDGGFPDGWQDARPGYGGSVWIPSAFKDAYRVLWDEINGQRDGGIFAWKENPWVWVLEFKVLTGSSI